MQENTFDLIKYFIKPLVKGINFLAILINCFYKVTNIQHSVYHTYIGWFNEKRYKSKLAVKDFNKEFFIYFSELCESSKGIKIRLNFSLIFMMRILSIIWLPEKICVSCSARWHKQRERDRRQLAVYHTKFYNNVLLFVGLTTLGTYFNVF